MCIVVVMLPFGWSFEGLGGDADFFCVAIIVIVVLECDGGTCNYFDFDEPVCI